MITKSLATRTSGGNLHAVPSRFESSAYRAIGWGLTALGTIHVLLVPTAYRSLTADALWFAGTGVAVLLAGALNLCVQAGLAGPGARPLIVTCGLGNLALAGLAGAFVMDTSGLQPQGWLLFFLFFAAAIFAIRRLMSR